MKKWLAGGLLLLFLFTTGCESGEVEDSQSSVSLPSGTFDVEDLSISVNGQVFSANQPVDPLLEALGNDFEYVEMGNEAYDGLDKAYEYETILISTVPYEGKDLISEIFVQGGTTTTGKGLAVGASREEVEQAYGMDYTYADGILTYWAGEEGALQTPYLYFFLDNDQLVSEFGILSYPLMSGGSE